MARVSTFQKIDGYKHIIKCAMCGKKSTSAKNNMYCEACQKKIQAEREAQPE